MDEARVGYRFGPTGTPIALLPLSLISTAVASVVAVAFLVWRAPSAWATVSGAVIAAAVMTVLPMVADWESREMWPVVVVYLTFFGVYVAIVMAMLAAAAVLYGRNGLRRPRRSRMVTTVS